MRVVHTIKVDWRRANNCPWSKVMAQVFVHFAPKKQNYRRQWLTLPLHLRPLESVEDLAVAVEAAVAVVAVAADVAVVADVTSPRSGCLSPSSAAW
jgi:hypothetical protein